MSEASSQQYIIVNPNSAPTLYFDGQSFDPSREGRKVYPSLEMAAYALHGLCQLADDPQKLEACVVKDGQGRPGDY